MIQPQEGEKNDLNFQLKKYFLYFSTILVAFIFVVANSFMATYAYKQWRPIKTIEIEEAAILNSPLQPGDTIKLYIRQELYIDAPAEVVYVSLCQGESKLPYVRSFGSYPTATDHGQVVDRIVEFVDVTYTLPSDFPTGKCMLGVSIRFDLDNNRTSSTFFEVPFEVIEKGGE